MNRHRFLTLLCIFLLITALAPAASARFATPEGSNAGINISDTVFLGERYANFSAFADPSQGSLEYLARIDEAGEPTDHIRISGSVATIIPQEIKPKVQYYPIYKDGGGEMSGPDRSKFCRVMNASACLGDLKIQAFDTDVQPPRGSYGSVSRPIPTTLAVQFLLPDNTLPVEEFNGPWYEFELNGTVKNTSEIQNINGERVMLTGLSGNPGAENRRFAFRFSDQDAFEGEKESQATMILRMPLSNRGDKHHLDSELSETGSWTFGVEDCPPTLKLANTITSRGKTISLTLHGVPFMRYAVTLPEGLDYPFFTGGGWDRKYSDFHVLVHPGWDGTCTLKIEIPDRAPLTDYTVRVSECRHPDRSGEATFFVEKVTLIFEKPGFPDFTYAFGDVVKLKGSGKNIRVAVPVYLYVTGPNLPKNGANLEDPRQEVVDGDPGTFTSVTYDPFRNSWEYRWWTKHYAEAGCEEGTYTVHANLEPVGYIRSAPDGEGSFDGDAPPAWEVPLNTPTINVKLANGEQCPAVFAQGDRLYGWWYARGSPGLTRPEATHGHIKWYIFGDNYRYADFNNHFPIYKGGSSDENDENDSEKVTDQPPFGVHGFTHSRNLTYNLEPGEYYIVFQHPGRDSRFDLLPEGDPLFRGQMNEAIDPEGRVGPVRVGALQARAAAEALTSALDSPYINDIYVMEKFIIERPSITIRAPATLTVGEDLIVNGTTNLAAPDKDADGNQVEDTLALTVTRLDLDGGRKANTAMKSETIYTTPKKSIDPYTGKRTFSFDPVKTGSWYPGKYEISIECRDVRYKNTAILELLDEGAHRDWTETRPPADPALSMDAPRTPSTGGVSGAADDQYPSLPDLTPLPWTTTPQQSGPLMPGAAAAALLLAVALRRW